MLVSLTKLWETACEATHHEVECGGGRNIGFYVLTEPMAWNDCESSRRNSERRGGPQVAMKGFAEVSRVESPEPTIKREPQKPPKDRYTAEGQNIRAPTPYMQRPTMNVHL